MTNLRRTIGISAMALVIALWQGANCRGDVEPPITAIAFAPGGQSVVVGSQGGIRVLTWPALQPQRTLDSELRHIHALAFSPNGKRLAAAGGTPGEWGTVELFTWPEVELAWRSSSPTDLVYSVDWAQDGSFLAAGSLDHTCQVLGAEPGNVVRILEGHSRGILAVRILNDGKTVVTGGIDQSLRVWDFATGDAQRTLNNHTGTVVAIAVRLSAAPAGLPMIASVGEDRTVRFWQPTIGRLMRFARLPSAGLDAAWAIDGSTLFVSCRDGHLRQIDPDSVEVVDDRPVLEGWAYSLAVHPAGRRVLVGGQRGALKVVTLAEP